jgi:hypothetical protein
MRSFQLCEHKRVTVAGAVYIHARLKAQRGEDWSIVGVFQLTQDEWQALSEICNFHGIPVTQDEKQSAISS